MVQIESLDCEQGLASTSKLEEWREQEDEKRGSGGEGEIEPEEHAVHEAREELPLGHVPVGALLGRVARQDSAQTLQHVLLLRAVCHTSLMRAPAHWRRRLRLRRH